MDKKAEKIFTAERVLLIGLGGVGSRVVNSIMGNIPDEYKTYTQAVALDTDRNDVMCLNNIPAKNIIRLGGKDTIDSFMKRNEAAADWMVKGRQLGLIKSRTTSNGSSQLRLISRAALYETIENGDFNRKFDEVINSLNAIDDGIQGKRLRVLVVSSVAGGTGAGTVIQLPMYLEDIIKNSYSSENVRFECAMLMPNMFAEKISVMNLEKAKANAYAVIKEIVSLNSGKIKRSEYLDNIDVDANDDRGVPYGRIMVFDDRTGRGESIKGDIDTVHTPLVVDALTEYLYGPANGKIVSALDNTLAAVYAGGGEAIFGAIGKASIVYPKEIYQQYAALKWLESSISKTWLYPDYKAEEAYHRELKDAEKNDDESYEKIKKSYEENKSLWYCSTVYSAYSSFFDSIKKQLAPESHDYLIKSLAEEYWKNVTEEFLERYFKENEEFLLTYFSSIPHEEAFIYRKKKVLPDIKRHFNMCLEELDGASCKISPFVDDIMRPMESKKDGYYDNKEDNDEIVIARFIRNKNLHPVALRCFLYELYKILEENIAITSIPGVSHISNSKWNDMFKKRKSRGDNARKLKYRMLDQAQRHYNSEIAMRMLPFLKVLIQEVEDFFAGIKKAQEYFSNAAERLLPAVENLDSAADKVVAGSAMSMRNCWKLLEKTIGKSGAENQVDDNLSEKLNKLICEGYFKHINDAPRTRVKIGSDEFRIATNYVEVLLEELPNYFNNKIKTEYSSFFPENVIEAVKYDCCVKNFWNIMKNEIECITEDDFICEEPTNEEYYEEAKRKGFPAFDFNKTLTRLLAKGVGKAEPRCGIIKIDGDSDYTTRYVIMNEDILQKTTKADDEDVFNEKIVPVYSEFVPGVSTTDIDGTFVNACFNGESKDMITFVTSCSGLCPKNFASLVDSSCNECQAKDVTNYFEAYSAYITKINEDDMNITPHLHCGWHLPGKLVDITH